MARTDAARCASESVARRLRVGGCVSRAARRCRQLLSEQEVQARAADAARANVEAHYQHLLTAFQAFMDK
jgi:hypothetical protein